MKKTADRASVFITYKRLYQSTKHYLSFFIIGVVTTLMVSGIDAGLTWLIKPIINEVFIARNSLFIRWMPLVLIGAILLRIICNFCSNYFVSRVARGVVMDMRRQVFGHLLKMPASYYDNHSSAHMLAALVYNVDQIAEAASSALISVLQNVGLVIGMVTVLFLLSWQITVILAVLAPILVWLTVTCSKRLRKLSHHVQSSIGEVTQIAEEAIASYKVIRLDGLQASETEKFSKATDLNRRREIKMVVTNILNNSIVQLIVALPAVGFLALVTSSFIHISAGSFTALITALFGLLRPAKQVGRINTTIQKGIAGAESVFETIDRPVEPDTGTFHYPRKVRGHIEYRNVRFAYAHAAAPILDGVSFEVQPGQTIALVGRSGSGKTTTMNLLPRFYELEQGEILVDGTPIRDVALASLREQTAFVTQHTTLFNTTIADNIACGKLGASRSEIMAAAESAHAMDFIRDLPNGLETVVGENGVMLSGGQRQRIAIARALIKDAPILLLDEATSSLDSHAERHIQAALETLTRNRTTIVIAHRLSTVEHADQILVMDQGRVIEQGCHAELLAKKGAYAELYRMQFAE